MGIWVPQKQLMILFWIDQKTLEVEGVIKLRVFGLQVEPSEHQAQILEPRDKGMYVHADAEVLCYRRVQV